MGTQVEAEIPKAGTARPPDWIVTWKREESAHAADLARTAARIGALDERLRQGPHGWRHRLALTEASNLSWWSGGRIAIDRLGLWIALRAGPLEDSRALNRASWAFRRLAGGPGPEEGLAAFLARPEELLADRADAWADMMARAAELHPITRAALAFHLWPQADIGPSGEPLEGAVIAARIAVAEGQGGAVFAPMAMGGAGALRASGALGERLPAWLEGLNQGALTAMRALDRIEVWEREAREATTSLKGRTPALMIDALRDWPMLSAPMAEKLTGASRAAVQRNFDTLVGLGLVAEITRQSRFRLWRAAV